MQTRKLTEVPQADFSKETNFIVEIDEELKRVPGSSVRRLVSEEKARAEAAEKKLADDLAAEQLRAVMAENTNADHLAAEASRAAAAEIKLAGDLTAEVLRAETEETELREQMEARTAAVDKEIQSLRQADSDLDEKKVDRADGMGLSSNDYTDEEKADLADANRKKHTHENGGVLDQVTREGLDHWDAAFAHISDRADPHDGIYVKNIFRTLLLTADGWSASYPYTQTVPVSGISAGDDIRVAGVYVPEGAIPDQIEAWSDAAGCLMYSPDGVADGAVTFRAYERPQTDVRIITEGG